MLSYTWHFISTSPCHLKLQRNCVQNWTGVMDVRTHPLHPSTFFIWLSMENSEHFQDFQLLHFSSQRGQWQCCIWEMTSVNLQHCVGVWGNGHKVWGSGRRGFWGYEIFYSSKRSHEVFFFHEGLLNFFPPCFVWKGSLNNSSIFHFLWGYEIIYFHLTLSLADPLYEKNSYKKNVGSQYHNIHFAKIRRKFVLILLLINHCLH